jgi:hypothetical protein
MTLEQINAQYAAICREIGDAKFQILQFELFITKKLAEAEKLNELAGLLNSQKQLPNLLDTTDSNNS